MSAIKPGTEIGGAKVTLTPSEQIVKSSAQEICVTDALGHELRLKKPNPLANLDFAKAAGSDKLNLLYLAEVAHLKFIAAIDDVPVATPTTEAELRALYQRLGEEGNEAAQRAVAEHFMNATAAQKEEAELKNS